MVMFFGKVEGIYFLGFYFFKGLLFNSGALCDVVPFVQFKKREEHPWRSVTFSKVTGFRLL